MFLSGQFLTQRSGHCLAGQTEGVLYLQGLTSLSDEAAKALANHTGQLLLNGVTEISDEAKALAHANQINLSGLTSLSDEAAEALATHMGEGNSN